MQGELGSVTRGRKRTQQQVIRWWPALVAVLGVLIAAYFVLRPTSAPGLVGHPAPDFTLRDTQGNTVQLAALRGHPVLLNFWGVSCIYCRVEMPLLQQAYLQHKSKGLIVLGVDVQPNVDDLQSIQSFAAGHGATYPMVVDSQHLTVATLYGIDPLPESVLIDRQGIVRQADAKPFLEASTLQQALNGIL